MKVQTKTTIFILMCFLFMSMFCLHSFSMNVFAAEGSTELNLRQVENPFQKGDDQTITINEGEDQTLVGTITGGFGTVTYIWEISTDGGLTWEVIPRAGNLTYQITDAVSGTYLYRLTATDAYGNEETQTFTVVVHAVPGINESSIVQTGDPINAVSVVAGLLGSGLVVLSVWAVRQKERSENKNE